MKIKQKWDAGTCEAMRCKGEASKLVPLEPFLEGLAPTARAVLTATRSTGTVALCAVCDAKYTIAFRARTPFGQARSAEEVGADVALAPEKNASRLASVREHRETTEEAPPVAVIPTASVESEIAANRAYALEQIETVKLLEIETREDFDLFAELLAEVKGKLKAITARKEEITKPMNAALKSVRDLFRSAEVPLADAETAIKRAIGAYTLREEQARQRAMQAAADAHAAGDAEGTAHALAQVVTTKNVAGLSARKVWAFEIVDASLVPREYLVVDERLVRAHAASAKDHEPTPIPGVRFYPDTVVSSRSAS